MSISFPLAMPTTRAPMRVDFRAETQAGFSESPFSFSPQTYLWPAERWLGSMEWGVLGRADSDVVAAFYLALNGREGSFLMGDLMRTVPRGTWAGQSPLVNGASQTGKVLNIDGVTPTTTTCLSGDWFQLGTGATSRIYRLTKDATANGSGQVTLDFWPRLRETPADNAALTLASPKGLFMLAGNTRGWTQADVREFGIALEFVEDLRGL
jgi:hypothetical protein